MRYTDGMIIEHQKIVDADGKPTAIVIPWDNFQVIKAEMAGPEDAEDQWMEVVERRSQEMEDGRVKGIPHEEMISRVRQTLHRKRAAKQGA